MRSSGFLRTPIRSDHQSRLKNLQVSEQGFDPSPGDPSPQTLLISFKLAQGQSEVQTAPL
jgi:hypothetical protein